MQEGEAEDREMFQGSSVRAGTAAGLATEVAHGTKSASNTTIYYAGASLEFLRFCNVRPTSASTANSFRSDPNAD